LLTMMVGAVRRGARDAADGDAAARAADVLDHHRLRQRLAQGLGQDARERVEQAACGIGHHHRDRTRRIALCPREARHCRERGSGRGEMQESAAA
jgi:hypothetical protein